MLESDNAGESGQGKFALVSIRLPVALTFAALIGGLLAGIAGAAWGAPQWVSDIASLIGGLWLRALQMTIIPLVAALLVLGLVQMIMAARVGTAARRMLAVMIAVQLALDNRDPIPKDSSLKILTSGRLGAPGAAARRQPARERVGGEVSDQRPQCWPTPE